MIIIVNSHHVLLLASLSRVALENVSLTWYNEDTGEVDMEKAYSHDTATAESQVASSSSWAVLVGRMLGLAVGLRCGTNASSSDAVAVTDKCPGKLDSWSVCLWACAEVPCRRGGKWDDKQNLGQILWADELTDANWFLRHHRPLLCYTGTGQLQSLNIYQHSVLL